MLDTLGHVEGLSRGSVRDYLTSAKHHYLVDRQLFGPPSPAWGPRGHHHPLVSQMINSIPVRHRAVKRLLSDDWIRDGFERCWTTAEYVTIAVLLGWILRVGEGCDMDSAHLLTWDTVTFSIFRHNSWQTLPMSLLRTTPCDKIDLLPRSRKYQPEPRPMPGRMNTSHLDPPVTGVTHWCHLCMPTILQAWAIMNNVDHLPPTTLATRPLLALPGGAWPLSRAQVADALRRLARLRGEDETTVVPHCLRKTGISKLANSRLIENQDRYLRTVGHHHIQSSDNYVVPDATAAAAVTRAQHQLPTLTPPTNR